MVCKCGKECGNFRMCFGCNKKSIEEKTRCKCGTLYNSKCGVYKMCYECNKKTKSICPGVIGKPDCNNLINGNGKFKICFDCVMTNKINNDVYNFMDYD